MSLAGFRKNLFAGFYATGVQTVGQIALVPLFLQAWGQVRYGEWLVVFSLPLYLTLSDVGINNALGNAFTLAVSAGEFAKATRMVSAAWRSQLWFAGILLAAAIALAGLLPLRALLGLHALSTVELQGTLLALSVYVLLVVQAGIFGAVFRAARRYHSYQWALGHTRAVEILATVAVLLLGRGLVELALTLAAVRLLGLVWLWVESRSLLPDAHIVWSAGSWSDYRALLPDGAAFFVFPVSNAIANQGTTLVVQHLGGPVAVVLVSVCRQLARLFSQGVSLLMSSSHPELTSAYGRGDLPRMRKLQAQVTSIALWAAWPFVVGVAVAGPWILLRWTGSIEATRSSLVLFAMEAVVVAISSLAALSAWAVSRVRGLAVVFFVAQSCALGGAAATYSLAGPVAVAGCFAVANLGYCVFAFAVSSAVLETRSLTFFADCIRALPVWLGSQFSRRTA